MIWYKYMKLGYNFSTWFRKVQSLRTDLSHRSTCVDIERTWCRKHFKIQIHSLTQQTPLIYKAIFCELRIVSCFRLSNLDSDGLPKIAELFVFFEIKKVDGFRQKLPAFADRFVTTVRRQQAERTIQAPSDGVIPRALINIAFSKAGLQAVEPMIEGSKMSLLTF